MAFRTHVHPIQLLGFASRATTANHRGPSSYYPIIPAEKPRSYVFKTRVRIESRNLNVFMYRCLQLYLVPIPCDSKSVWYRCIRNCIRNCIRICIRNCIRFFARPHNAEDTPGIRQSGRLRSLQSSLCKAEKHLHADPKPAQTMHKSQVVLEILYM